MKFTHYFETTAAFTEAYNGGKYKKLWVSYTKENNKVNYKKRHSEYLKEYFTIEALESGTIQWNFSGGTIEYSLNGGDWTTIDRLTILNVSEGDILRFRGNNNNYSAYVQARPTIYASFGYNVYGNIMSLISSTEFENLTTIPTISCFNYFFGGTNTNICKVVDASDLILPATTLMNYCYYGMFNNCTSLTSVPELPATTLTNGCYRLMFNNCKSLTTAPELPATTLANECYQSMFQDCKSLTTAPELPATTLINNCYNQMFYGCSNLTTAPELPATTLANSCYAYMFMGCTSLNYIKCLATNISASNCTNNWVRNVASSGTFVKNASMPRENWVDGNSGIPTGWTVQDA